MDNLPEEAIEAEREHKAEQRNLVAICVVWAVFVAVFFCLAWEHYHLAKQESPRFVFQDRPQAGMARMEVLGVGLDAQLKRFVESYNQQLAGQDQHLGKLNRSAAWGHFIAGLTALFSLALELYNAWRHRLRFHWPEMAPILDADEPSERGSSPIGSNTEGPETSANPVPPKPQPISQDVPTPQPPGPGAASEPAGPRTSTDRGD